MENTHYREEFDDSEESSNEGVKEIEEWIYGTYFPPYLQTSWSKGRGRWYEDWPR